tara:strand:- start:122 stop:583 length:462 start_codon:yes stop_codon:yes gene_type:complete
MKKINSNLYKLAMSKFATGVTVVSINYNNNYIGKTVNSFSALSLDPPLVLFSLDKKSSSIQQYKNSKYFGINILAKNQKKISTHFSKQKPKWGDTSYFLTTNNIPLIKNSSVNINCKKIKNISQGDHIIFVCKIIEVKIFNKKPLVYLNSKYI